MENHQTQGGRGRPHLRRYLGLTRDPMHVGEGAQAVGPIDNTICRCKSTQIPIIPGTSIRGCLERNIRLTGTNDDVARKALLSQLMGAAEEGDTRQGRLHAYQGDVLFFPVSTFLGTVWITWPEVLRRWFCWTEEQLAPLFEAFGELEDTCVQLGNRPRFQPQSRYLGLGDGGIRLPVASRPEGCGATLSTQALPSELGVVRDRLFALPEMLFSQIVNDNLEVRMSVKIDDTTGAAADKALFNYEALPALTVLGFEFGVEHGTTGSKGEIDAFALVERGLEAFEYMGIGAKTTSGMGHFASYKDRLPIPEGWA